MSIDDTTMNPTTTPTLPGGPFSRRRLLAGVGVIGAALVAAACGSDDNGSGGSTVTTAAPLGSTATTAAPGTTGATDSTMATATTMATDTTGAADGAATDGKIATLAAGLEVLAVGTYKAALDAATAGSLGTVPPAVAEFVTKAMSQHQAHLDAWNKVLVAAGAPEVTEPNATLKPTVDSEFAKVTDVGGAAKLALMLEQIAAATYQSAIPVLSSKDAITLAGSIQIIDFQHAAILNFVLGNYPVPDTFGKLDLAVSA
jgi:hypothetical protein